MKKFWDEFKAPFVEMWETPSFQEGLTALKWLFIIIGALLGLYVLFVIIVVLNDLKFFEHKIVHGLFIVGFIYYFGNGLEKAMNKRDEWLQSQFDSVSYKIDLLSEQISEIQKEENR